ncbi:MAG: hypothetical protein R2705_12740 [Ilumatobacteraceae bacterium]
MDRLLSTVEYALGGLQLRTDTIAHNVANQNTPLYRSKVVNFEQNLAQALAAGKAAPDRSTGTAGGYDLVDAHGTSVSLENELTEMAKTALSRQTLVSAFNYKVDMAKTAVNAR